MDYKIGSLSTFISGIKESTSKTIIFKEKAAQENSTPIAPKHERKRKHTEIDKSVTKKSKHSSRRLKVTRLENGCKETGEATDVAEDDIPLTSNATAKNNSFLTSHSNTNAVNALKRITAKQSIKNLIQDAEQSFKKYIHDPEQESRTIFVKNLPHSLDKKKIKKIFKKFGNIESVRLRCAAVEDIGKSKKFAVIKNKFHSERSSICAFIRFQLREDALSAQAANGTVIQDHHIFVDEAINSAKHDQKKSIFLGNVPFSAEEEEIWKIFEKCGKIVDIRIVRDMKTGIGKGFSYVTFESSDAVELALSLNGTPLKDRPLRISRVVRKRKPAIGHLSNKIRQQSGGKSKQNAGFVGKNKNKFKKGKKKVDENSAPRNFSHFPSEKDDKKKEKQKHLPFQGQKSLDKKQKHLPFQGQKSLDKKQKKKQKVNKMEQKKKIIALKLKHKADPEKKGAVK